MSILAGLMKRKRLRKKRKEKASRTAFHRYSLSVAIRKQMRRVLLVAKPKVARLLTRRNGNLLFFPMN